MLKKRLVFLSFLLIGVLALAACAPAPADDGSAARIAELEAALAEASAAGTSDAELEAMKAELEALSDELMEAESAQCTFNAYRMGWIMDWADAGNIVDTVFGPTSDFQYSLWQLSYPDVASAFGDLTLSAYRDTDLENRSATWQEAEKLLLEELTTVVPIYHYDRTTLVTTDVVPLFPPFGAPRMADWVPVEGKTVMRWSAGNSIPTLDPSRATDTTSDTVITQMIDTPFSFDAEGGIEPLGAESFEVSDDGTVFTVYLREDAVWSDGVPVTAQHYVDGVKRLLSPDMANDYAYIMFDIVGAADYNSGDAADLESIVALDDYTFQFTLSEPRSYFDSILAFRTFNPLRIDVIEEFGDEWTRPGNFVSNGAFVMVEHNPGDNLIMEKNETYWGADDVPFDQIEVSMIGEPATSLAAFENGELDWTAQGSFPPEDIPRLVDTPEFLRTPRPGTYYLGLNTTAQHTSNQTFREALSLAVDKRTILDNVAETPWRTVAYGVIPPEIVGYQGDAVGYSFDAAAAQAKLAEYMAEADIAEAGDIVVELWYNKGGANQEILEAVEAMWEENLGIDVRTVNVEWATYLETLEECNVIGGGGF
jgi:oligopeptide transport system substrate-binding protein